MGLAKWRFTAPQTHLWLLKDWHYASTFLFMYQAPHPLGGTLALRCNVRWPGGPPSHLFHVEAAIEAKTESAQKPST